MNKTEKDARKQKLAETVGKTAVHIRRSAASKLRQATRAVRSSRLVRTVSTPESIKTATKAAKCAGLCLAAFMLGRCNLGFEVYPLGLALLISSGQLTFFAYMGSAIAALTYASNGFAFFGVNTLIYIIRKLLLSDGFCESRKVRVILGFFSGIFISAALALQKGLLGSELFDTQNLVFCCAVYTAVLPIAVYLLCPVTSSESFGEGKVRAALTFFCMCLIMAANFTFPGGMYVSVFLACCGSLAFCLYFEPGFALCASALFGFSTLSFAFAAPLAVSGFVYQKLEKNDSKAYLAAPAFAAVCSVLSLAVLDFSHYSLALIIYIFLSAIIFLPIGLIARNIADTSPEASPAREAVSEAYTRRMTSLAGAFGSVSKLCFGLSGRLRFPDADEASVIASVAGAKVCRLCAHARTCKYKSMYSDSSVVQGLMSGRLTVGKLPEKLKNACPNTGKIIDEINDGYKKLLTERFNNNKTEILAYEYSTLARILKYTSRLSSEDVYYDGALTKKAVAATKKLGLPNSGTTVYGSRKKVLDISGVPVSAVSTPSENMAAFYSAECGVIFDIPEFILDENSTFTMRFVSKEMIAVEYVKAVHTKTGETVSGDTVSFFRSDDSFFYALIADGMGSGRDAAMTSRITSVFVEKLLSGGAGKGVTMELLNSLLMSKSKECFSSVDLLELDLITRRASFVKAGAAPAYLLRSAKLFKVSSDTPPCGIIEGFCAENTSFEVFSGDVIIMLSDGITSSIDCAGTLCEIMNNSKGMSAEAIAAKILDTAVSLAVHDDDMSCVLVRIK